MLVWQHEIIEYVERIMSGFEINDNTLALNLIDQVGPGGTFIEQTHTTEHFRSELWMPKLLDRNYWTRWEQDGRTDTAKRVRERVDELLSAGEPIALEDEVERRVNRVLAEARDICSGRS